MRLLQVVDKPLFNILLKATYFSISNIIYEIWETSDSEKKIKDNITRETITKWRSCNNIPNVV